MLRTLWLLAACCVFLRRLCEAGILAPPPGHWNEAQHMWVATAEEDQLSDLIGAPLPDVPYVTPQAIHGMSFGDSNDRNIINDYCAKPEPHPPRHEIDSIRACWHANLTMTWQPLVGIHPTGPYWQGIQGSPPQRLQHGLIAQLRTFQSPPDFITFSSNLWDLWGWGNHKPEILSNDQVEAAALAEWAGHMSALMTQIEGNVPAETMLIYRTGAPGSWGQCPNKDGTPIANYVGVTLNHMLQLNMAAKKVLEHHPRWHILDLELLLADVKCPQDYLRDFVHVDAHVAWNILNIYLNMLKKFWDSNGEPPWRK